MRQYSTSIAALSLLIFTSCATGFNRELMHTEIAADGFSEVMRPEYEVEIVHKDNNSVSADDIRRELSRRPQLKTPARIAVYLDGESTWRWTIKDKELVSDWAKPLRSTGLVADIFVISDIVSGKKSSVKAASLEAVRLAGAKYGADAVLYIKGLGQIDDYNNPLSILYLTIVGYYIFPGTHADALFLTQGALWDVGNEYLYLTVESEGEASSFGPGAFVDEAEVLDEARHKALSSFGEEFVERIEGLRSSTQKSGMLK